MGGTSEGGGGIRDGMAWNKSERHAMDGIKGEQRLKGMKKERIKGDEKGLQLEEGMREFGWIRTGEEYWKRKKQKIKIKWK